MAKTYKITERTVANYPTTEQYQGVQYNDSAYKSRVDTSYYDNAKNQYNEQAEKDRATQLGEASKNLDSTLRQAYVTKMQNQQTLNDNLARSGIRGGTTETANLRLQNNYGQARSAANTDYTNSVNSINQSIDKNKLDYAMDMDARAEEYRQNMAQALWNADREDYSNAYNARREDAINLWQAQNDADAANVQAANDRAINLWNAAREDKQQKIENTRTKKQDAYEHWTDAYAGKSDKFLKNKLKEINKKLKSKKLTSAQKIKLNAQKRAIGRIQGDRRAE